MFERKGPGISGAGSRPTGGETDWGYPQTYRRDSKEGKRVAWLWDEIKTT